MTTISQNIFFAIGLLSMSTYCLGTDFNDGIQGDTPIQDRIQEDVNINFIIQRAQARARAETDLETRNVITNNDADQNSGIGNIIIGPGTNLKGAIILNDSENQGASTTSK